MLTNSLAATDVASVHAGYARYRRDLLRGGVELFEMKPSPGNESLRQRISWKGSSHASLQGKVVVIDDRWSFVGSMNLDPCSVNINTEMGVLVDSPGLRAQFEQNTAPEASYALLLDPARGLAWRDRANGEERRRYADPDVRAGRRFMVLFMGALPLESQL